MPTEDYKIVCFSAKVVYPPSHVFPFAFSLIACCHQHPATSSAPYHHQPGQLPSCGSLLPGNRECTLRKLCLEGHTQAVRGTEQSSSLCNVLNPEFRIFFLSELSSDLSLIQREDSEIVSRIINLLRYLPDLLKMT